MPDSKKAPPHLHGAMEPIVVQNLFFLSDSAYTKDEADDDDDKCQCQKYVIVFENEERTHSCQY